MNEYLTKCVAISTNDRDISKWKNQNHFEIVLPQYIKNIVSMRISKLTLPAYFYNFCNEYQNTKFQFRLKPSKLIPQNDIYEIKYYEVLALNQNKYFEVTIPDGLYCCSELAILLENLMNNAVTNFLEKHTNIPEMYKTYTHFKCFNDDVKKKFGLVMIEMHLYLNLAMILIIIQIVTIRKYSMIIVVGGYHII